MMLFWNTSSSQSLCFIFKLFSILANASWKSFMRNIGRIVGMECVLCMQTQITVLSVLFLTPHPALMKVSFHFILFSLCSLFLGLFLLFLFISALMKHLVLDKLFHGYIFDSLVSIFFKLNVRVNICSSLFLKPSFWLF